MFLVASILSICLKSDIDFTMPALKQKLSLNTDISVTTCTSPGTCKKSLAVIPKPTECDLDAFYSNLAEMRKVPLFNEAYVPIYETETMPKPLLDLYDEDATKLTYPEL